MKDLARLALDTTRSRGASYGDVRVIQHREQTMRVKNGDIEALSEVADHGLGVRVLADGSWGVASSAALTRKRVDKAAAFAVQIARPSALARDAPVDLGPPVASTSTYITPVEIDPFSVPFHEKVALLMGADRGMRRVNGVRKTLATVVSGRDKKADASTKGALTEQEIIETGAGIVALAMGSGEVQQRSCPNSFGRDQRTLGWEHIQDIDLPRDAERVASESAALLSAELCPSKVTLWSMGRGISTP